MPFDLPEAESELVAGFFTEYSGMRFAFFLHRGIREHDPGVLRRRGPLWAAGTPSSRHDSLGHLGLDALAWIENVVWFAAKVYFFLFLFFWLRATLPRLRYDQLMRFGWKVMLPIALGNIVLTAIAAYFFPR